jgi:hypothetical protein
VTIFIIHQKKEKLMKFAKTITFITAASLAVGCTETLDEGTMGQELTSDMISLRDDLRSGGLNADMLLSGGHLQYCEYIADAFSLDRVLTSWECRCYAGLGNVLDPGGLDLLAEQGSCEGDVLRYCDAETGEVQVTNCSEMNLNCGMNDDLGVYDCYEH